MGILGIFLIMGSAGFISSTVVSLLLLHRRHVKSANTNHTAQDLKSSQVLCKGFERSWSAYVLSVARSR